MWNLSGGCFFIFLFKTLFVAASPIICGIETGTLIKYTYIPAYQALDLAATGGAFFQGRSGN